MIVSGTKSFAGSGYHGHLVPLGEMEVLEARWRALEAESDCSFFLTWSWIGPWLRLQLNRTQLFLYECHRDGLLIALAIVCFDTTVRHLFFRSKTISLNECPRESYRMFIEYNGLLVRSGHETAIMDQFVADVCASNPDWDEIRLPNVPEKLVRTTRAQQLDLKRITDEELTVWIAPLHHTDDLESILNRLSKNRRWQIRRSIKEYEKEGPLTINAAHNAEQARAYFTLMGVVHTERWNRVGKSGSFSQAEWVTFHCDLIDFAFDRGEIQMLQIRCGERPIGYLYNFVREDSVLMLQSGFVREASNKLRPGYVSHLLSMQYNAARGAHHYNFLAGDAELKHVLGVADTSLISLRLQRPRFKFTVESILIHIYRPLRRALQGLRSTKVEKIFTRVMCMTVVGGNLWNEGQNYIF